MPLVFVVRPGKVFQPDELVTLAKLNQLGVPTIEVLNDDISIIVPDYSISTNKLADGVLAASTAGRAKLADGFFTDAELAKFAAGLFAASADGRAKFADGFWTTATLAKFADGLLSADATGRAKMADLFVTAAKLDLAAQGSVHQYATGALTTGVYAVTLAPAATAYTAGMVVRFKPDLTNAGAVDLAVNGLAAKNIFKNVTLELAAGDLLANRIVELVYDGTNFQLRQEVTYASAETTIAAGALINAAHGLGGTPRHVRAVLVAQSSPDTSFAAGDEVAVESFYDSTFGPYFSFGANSTNAWLTVQSGALNIFVLRKDTGAQLAIDETKWKAKLTAQL